MSGVVQLRTLVRREESTREREQAEAPDGAGRGSSEHSGRLSSCDLLHCTVHLSIQRTWKERGPAVRCPRGFEESGRPAPEVVRLRQHRRRQSPRLDIRRCSSVSPALLSCSSELPSRYAPPDRRSRPVVAPLQKPGVRLTARPLSVARCGVDKSSEHSSRATECSTTRADSKDAGATAWSGPHHGGDSRPPGNDDTYDLRWSGTLSGARPTTL